MIVKKLSKFTLLISLAGFFVSLYALILHIKNLMEPGGGSLCDISATVSCTTVIGSRYGEFASIPLGAYGMAYFAIMLSAVLTPKFAQISKKHLAGLELIIGVVGVIFVGILMGISYGILKMVCPTCTIIHVLIIIYTIIKCVQFFKSRKSDAIHTSHENNQNTDFGDAFTKFFALSICLAIPPLAVGVFTPFLVNYFGKKDVPEATQQITQHSNEITKSVNQDLLTFNKSNYIGNGEDYRLGSDSAPIIVQVFSDFGCPHCKTADASLVKAQDIIGQDKVLLVFRFYPLSNECNSFVGGKGWYTYNCSLIVASRCAGQQGKFQEFKTWAFNGQDWTNQERTKNFSTEGLKVEAEVLNMDTESFMQCMAGHSEDQKIKDDIIFANQLNIQGTPLIMINGTMYQGPLDSESFVRAFEHAL